MFILQLFGSITFFREAPRPAPPVAPALPQQVLGPAIERPYINPAIFTRRMSTAMCHQPQSQSQGFTLSLRGFEPAFDLNAALRQPPPRRLP